MSLQNLLNNQQIAVDPLNFIGILIAAVVSIYIFKADIPFSYLQERHEKLIFPLFDLLEPVLYQKVSDSSLWKEIFDLIEKNKSLADGKLLSIYYYCRQNQSDENFISLCSYADRAYDKSCRALKLKKRSVEYRISRKQYKNKSYFILYISASCLIFLVWFLIALTIFLSIASIIYAIYVAANDMEKSILALFLCVITLAVLKYSERHP